MTLRSKINFGLLTLALLLTAAIFLTQNKQATYLPETLTSLDPGQINQIKIENRNGAFLIQKNSPEWQIIEPVEAAANKERIERLLKLLTATSYQQFKPAKEQLPQFGLTPSSANITFDQLKITMGGTQPYNHRRYIQIDDWVHLIDDNFPHHFLAGVHGFISKNEH
ncbi:MAG: DUF4340 domain-containing protein [Gammaproteobacteria bacterium]|nr:DUF4340 domain-containing protein [Gammaproteobacteria bacterium]